MLWLAVLALLACQRETVPPSETTTGQGAGGCPAGAAPLFTLTVRAAEAASLPEDTTLRVKWSAGEEPVLVLNDPETHLSLDDDGVNFECQIDRQQDLTMLDELVCELWTSGATEVNASATGYADYQATFQPLELEGCDAAIPSEVEVVLEPELEAGR